jgi:hypothetical protein
VTTADIHRTGDRIDRAARQEQGLRQVARAMRETPDMTTRVVDLAKGLGWLAYHALPAVNARGRHLTATQGHVGFPDLALVHETVPVAVAAELKRYGRGKDSRPTDMQARWLSAYGAIPGILAACWTTYDLVSGRIAALLADPRECARLAALPYTPMEG